MSAHKQIEIGCTHSHNSGKLIFITCTCGTSQGTMEDFFGPLKLEDKLLVDCHRCSKLPCWTFPALVQYIRHTTDQLDQHRDNLSMNLNTEWKIMDVASPSFMLCKLGNYSSYDSLKQTQPGLTQEKGLPEMRGILLSNLFEYGINYISKHSHKSLPVTSNPSQKKGNQRLCAGLTK